MRLILIAVLAVFVVGLGIKAASAATMDFAMAMSGDAGMDMLNCSACDASEPDASCDFDCTISSIADLALWSAVSTPRTAQGILPGVDRLAGYTGPPDPYPPR